MFKDQLPLELYNTKTKTRAMVKQEYKEKTFTENLYFSE